MRLRDSRSTRQFVYTRIDLIKTKWNYLRIKRRREATTTTTTAANRSRFRYNVCERNEIISLNFAHSHTNIECTLDIHTFILTRRGEAFTRSNRNGSGTKMSIECSFNCHFTILYAVLCVCAHNFTIENGDECDGRGTKRKRVNEHRTAANEQIKTKQIGPIDNNNWPCLHFIWIAFAFCSLRMHVSFLLCSNGYNVAAFAWLKHGITVCNEKLIKYLHLICAHNDSVSFYSVSIVECTRIHACIVAANTICVRFGCKVSMIFRLSFLRFVFRTALGIQCSRNMAVHSKVRTHCAIIK